jgi:hypothetical protein
MSELCPTCGQVLPWKREARKGSKMLQDDLSKAQHAIDSLYAVLSNPQSKMGWNEHWSEKEMECFMEACQLEIERLTIALSNHKLLWAIYRRASKGGILAYS